jgi:hypothetical protein
LSSTSTTSHQSPTSNPPITNPPTYQSPITSHQSPTTSALALTTLRDEIQRTSLEDKL